MPRQVSQVRPKNVWQNGAERGFGQPPPNPISGLRQNQYHPPASTIDPPLALLPPSAREA
jgi:hypothetical protein